MFPILFDAAFFAALDDRPQFIMCKYAEKFIRSIKEENVKVEIVNPKEHLYLLRGCVWLLIITLEQNMTNKTSTFWRPESKSDKINQSKLL